MPTSSLNCKFAVTNVPREAEVDTRQLIKKDIPHVRFSDSVGDDHVNIAYVSISEIDLANNMSIIDKSKLLPENFISDSITDIDIAFTGSTYNNVFTPSFLVTNQVSIATSTAPSIPLYYNHKAPNAIGGKQIVDFEVLDNNFEPVQSHLYLKDIQEGNIYTNLTNSHDSITGDLNLYYVRYFFDDNLTQDVVLNANKLYTQADPEDLSDLGTLIPGTNHYLFSFNSISGEYDLTLPASDDYYIRYTSVSHVSVVEPNVKVTDRIWFLRIKNGRFIKDFVGDGTYEYDIVEFHDQLFNPYEPYKFAQFKSSTILPNNIVQLPDGNLTVYIGASLHVDIVISDSAGNPLYAATTVSSKHALQYVDFTGAHEGIFWDANLIHSYDERNGFVKLNAELSSSYKANSSYYYVENFYELTTLNVNPISDASITNYRIIIYVVPTGPLNDRKVKSVYYLKVDTNGIVIDCSQRGDDDHNLDLVTGAILDVDVTDNFMPDSYVFGDYTSASRTDLTPTVLEDSVANYIVGSLVGLIMNPDTSQGVYKYSIIANTETTITVASSENMLSDLAAVGAVGTTYGLAPTGDISFIDDVNNKLYLNKVYGTFTNGMIVEQERVTEDISETPVTATISIVNNLNILDDNLSYDNDSVDNFVDRYTILGDDTEGTHYFVVGEVVVTDPYKDENMSNIDTRLLGGGIKERYEIGDLTKQQEEISWYEDFGSWDGLPYSGGSAILVKIPYSSLLDYGGVFNEEEIVAIVNKHVGYGTYPIIRFYGNVVEITEITPSSAQIDLIWNHLGDDFHYDVYTSIQKNNGYTKHNATPIVGSGSEVPYIIDLLSNGQPYFLHVVATDTITNIEYPKSSTWSAIPYEVS